ncbi:MAG: (2Fe-2S)-binding protein [Neisseria zoodegmatis]|uniref:(2Fe-2S)-binding protein n=1 Tax=Neisseria zoodegmatis TaxID=326523 RepID=UPI0026EBA9C0|nr:(2Fe-2S)-binding protein [Neisseria zoodegmatis]MDO5070440.1 (2Fe-2S)-binding protein [Neisseria zoodegmatis]
MFVCICNAITDRQIQETVAAGASSLSDLQAQLGVATCCGCCSELASSFLTGSNASSTSTMTAGINVQS